MPEIFNYKYGVKILLLAAIYFITAKIGLSLAFFFPQVTTIWPPSGIAIAALLLFGEDLWPGVTFGAFAINAISHEPILVALFIGIGNTLEAVICVRLLRKFDFDSGFHKMRDVIAFALFSFLACAAGAFIGTASLLAGGLTVPGDFFRAYLTWLVGDAVGAFLVVPLLLSWFMKSARRQFSKRGKESVLAFLFSSVVAIIIFFYPSSVISSQIKFLIFPFLIWGAFRLGLATVTTMNIMVGAVSTIATLEGIGPFFGSSSVEFNLMLSNLFIYVASGLSLLSFAAIEERNSVSDRIALSEKRLHSLTAQSSDGIILMNARGDILYLTGPMKNILGYSEPKLLTQNFFLLIHQADVASARDQFAELLGRPGKSVRFELQARHKQGYWVWLEVAATNLLNDPGVKAVVVNCRDVTERKHAEEKERSYTLELERAIARTAEDAAKQEALLANLGDGFIATDREGTIIFMNPAAERMIECPMSEMIGRSLDISLEMVDEGGAVLPRKERPIQIALSTGKPFASNPTGKPYYYVRRGGTRFPIALIVTPVILDGTIIGAEEIFRDVTRELQVDRAKTEFVSLASHQLRTPLSIMHWYLDALLKGKMGGFNKKQDEYLRQVYAANQRLVNTVNNLLNISRLEMGTFSANPSLLNLPDLVRGSIDTFSHQAEGKNIALTLKSVKGIPEIFIDRSILMAIVDNLVSNAVKYTDNGGTIAVSLSRDSHSFTVSVADNGYGIPHDEHARVFDRFYRGSNVVEKVTDGNGLGLYMVKRMVESMGGIIGFTSELGRGTTFSVTLPIVSEQERPHLPSKKTNHAIMT